MRPRALHPSIEGRATTDLSTLMALVAIGDQSAFAKLYDELAPAVYGVARRVVRDRDHADEVTQEVFVELWRKAARFDPSRGGLRAWVVTMARRRAVDRVRSEQSLRDREHRHGDDHQRALDTTADAVIDSLDRDRARHAMSELPDVQRQALELAFYDGLTHVEVAEKLGVALGTAKTRIRDGVIRLRTRMEAHP
jgi:RNA polymerase sigma-70 factor (ECF subfamily)